MYTYHVEIARNCSVEEPEAIFARLNIQVRPGNTVDMYDIAPK
jgi:hypothetical protein